MSDVIDFTRFSLYKSAAVTALCPTIWNILGRAEYNHNVISTVTLGSKLAGAYALAAWIFGFSTYRDICFQNAIDEQPTVFDDNEPARLVAGYSLLAVGTTFVMSSFARLGITGTFLGDYFGILMDDMVTGFPFNVLRDPMYVGATLNFLGLSALYVVCPPPPPPFRPLLSSDPPTPGATSNKKTHPNNNKHRKGSPAGVLLSAWVWVVYQISTDYFEGYVTRAYTHTIHTHTPQSLHEHDLPEEGRG